MSCALWNPGTAMAALLWLLFVSLVINALVSLGEKIAIMRVDLQIRRNRDGYGQR